MPAHKGRKKTGITTSLYDMFLIPPLKIISPELAQYTMDLSQTACNCMSKREKCERDT